MLRKEVLVDVVSRSKEWADIEDFHWIDRDTTEDRAASEEMLWQLRREL